MISPFRRRLLDAGLFFNAVLWGGTFLLVQGILPEIDATVMVAYRFLLSALFLAPWILRKKRPGALLREGVVLGALLMLLYIPQTAGLRYTTASNSGFITGLFILFVPLILFFFSNDRPKPGQWLAIGLALAGLWLLTGGISGINKGDALTLITALAYALHLLATDRYVRGDADAVLLAFHQFWFCGLASLVFAWAAGCPLGVASAKAAWIVVFLALFPNLLAFYIQLLAQKHTPAIKVSLIFSLEPVFAALFAWTVGGEPFSPVHALGCALMLSGMILGELTRLDLLGGRKKEVLPV